MTKNLIRATLAAIFLVAAVSGQAHAAAFEYADMMAVYLRYQSDIDYAAAADDYLRCQSPALWSDISNDEFKLGPKREETVRRLKAAVVHSESGSTFTLESTAQFGEYDPNAQRFSFRPFSIATHFSVGPAWQCAPVALPARIDLYFSNPELIDGLPMIPDTAKAFIEHRKSDRSVRITLTVKVTGTQGDDQLIGEIVHADVVDPLQQIAGSLVQFGK
jgi:hypothetical protein